MGNKMKKTIATVLFSSLAGVVNAADAELGTLYARDNAGYTIQKYSATWREGPAGIRVQTSRFTGGVESLGVGGDVQWTKGRLYVDGHAALMTVDSKRYVDGDINANYSVNDTVSVNLGVSADTIAGPTITPGTVNFNAATLGLEYNRGNFGALANTRYMWRTDSNNQAGWLVKAWATVYPGVSVYVTHREFTNSMVDPNYFSPLTYRRSGIGLTGRRAFGPVMVSVNLEPGAARINGEPSNTKLYKVEANWKVAKNARIIYSLGRDYGANGAYVYTYNMLTFRASF